MKRILKISLKILAGLLLLVGVLIAIVAFTDLMVEQFEEVEEAQLFKTEKELAKQPTQDSIKVMSWNLKFGGARINFFFDCYGDRVNMTAEEAEKNLAAIAAKIRDEDPAILLVQEIDLGSDRVAGMDQVQYILDHTQLNYAAYASQWYAYVPANGVGNVNSGIAVFSKYPIAEATRHALPQIAEQSTLTRFFYLRRAILTVKLKNGLQVVNTHMSAYSKDDTKKKQFAQFYQHVKGLKGDVLLGGDLNTVPPGAHKLEGFDDNVCKEDYIADDYSKETDFLKPLYKKYRPMIPLDRYLANEKAYFGHTVNGMGYWNRKLDFLFTNGAFKRGVVDQNTMALSDHAPLMGWWVRR